MKPQQIEMRNFDKFGKVTGKWYVRIGKKWRLFSQKEWDNGGIEWINKQLTSA